MKDFNQQEFNLLRKIHKKPNASSKRELASELNVETRETELCPKKN